MTEKISLRHMVNMKHLCSLRGSRAHSSSQPHRETEDVLVHTYTHGMLNVPWRDTLTVEEICTKAATLCGVPRLTSNLFGLLDKAEKKWLCPSSRLDPPNCCSPRKLVYCVRFHTLTASPSGDSSGFLSLDESIVSYMFSQYRESFLNDEIRGLSTEESLGLIVLDFMQYLKEEGISLANLNGRIRFGQFLPRSLNDGLSWWDKRKLRRKVRTALTDFRDDEREAFAFKVMFLVSLSEEMKETWGSEKFVTAKGDVYEVSGSKGVVKKNTMSDDPVQDSFQFEDIINVVIYPSKPETGHTIFQINRRSTPPMLLEMQSRYDAESFACLLDGYYRLLVDYYHYLNEDISPPSLVKLVKNRCHGPIPLSKAKQKIEEASQQEGLYLIRQNPEDHMSYCLTVRIDRELKNFKINHYEDDHVGLDNQPKFNNLRNFVEHYRSRENCWCLEGQLRRAVPIEPKERSLRLVDRSANEELPPQPEAGPQIKWIPEDSLSSREQWIHLGSGDFTDVCAADFRERVGKKTRKIRVAVKWPKPDAPQSVQQKFSQSVDCMSSWVHKYIIRFEGIGAGYKLIMEYASQGALDVYLRGLMEHRRRGLGLTTQLLIAFQLIDALEYLESRRIVHGNVSAHNVLVFKGEPKMYVKLADPMLSVYYHSLDQNSKQKRDRVRWTAPELLVTNAEPTLAGDKFSYAITLWQILSHGAIPAQTLSDREVRLNYMTGYRLEKPEPCPDSVFGIVQVCWNHTPKLRPQCKGVLRDINTLLQTSCSEGPECMDIMRDDDSVEMIPEESDDEEPSMDEENNKNERMDIGSPMVNSIEAVVERESLAGATGGISLAIFERHLNPGPDPYPDSEEEAKFYGVDKIQDGMLRREETLGAGHYGMVFHGKLKKHKAGFPEEDVAVKIIKSDNSESRPEQFQQEIRAMSRCDHKNIVKVLGYCEDNANRLVLVMEYFPFGSLEKYLRELKDKVTHKTLYLFGQQICQGMKYLHEVQRMVHRDLAARNVLVANESEVKITDFGLARIFGEDKDYYRAKETNQKVPIKWYAPEWLRHNKYQMESDVWSFGIILWEMFSYGQDPIYRDFTGKEVEANKLLDFFEKGQRLSPPSSCPNDIYNMMLECWVMDPRSRPKFRDLIPRMGRLIQQEEN